LRDSEGRRMGADRIRYLVFVCGRWRWRPTRPMRAMGFRLITFGRQLTADDKARAIALNEEWDKARRGLQPVAEKVYPAGSIGHGYTRALAIRAMERKAKAIVWTKEQAKRDDWPRAWRWIDPVFGDCAPGTVDPERLLALRTKVVERVSATEGHRVIKVWRALWKKLQAFGYCGANQKDPSLVFANTAPDPRQDVWQHGEVVELVDAAWFADKRGLAALMVVIWDTMLSPGDARTLTPGQRARDQRGQMFFLDRAKTGRAAAGTLTPWSEGILEAYLAELALPGTEMLDSAPIFRTAGSEPGPKGGRRWRPQPYSTSKMDRDFREIREAVFGPDEHRQLADMRRSGAVEGDAGGASLADQSNKMANTVAASSKLRKTYNPVNVTSVRRFDEARLRGRDAMQEQKPTKSVITGDGKVS
jgi:hypothetical protein